MNCFKVFYDTKASHTNIPTGKPRIHYPDYTSPGSTGKTDSIKYRLLLGTCLGDLFAGH